MNEVKRFDSDVSFNCIYADDGNLVRAVDHLAAIAERDAEIERLRATIRDAVKRINMLPIQYHGEIKMRGACRDIVAAIIKEFYP